MFETKGAKEVQKEKSGAGSRRKVKARRKLQFHSDIHSEYQVPTFEDKNPFSKSSTLISLSKLENPKCQDLANVIICMERGHPGSESPSSLKRRADNSHYEGVTGVKKFKMGSILEQ